MNRTFRMLGLCLLLSVWSYAVRAADGELRVDAAGTGTHMVALNDSTGTGKP